MAYQPKSYRKFVATAATATLVASAVTPAFAASFTDVGDRYKEAVDYLVANNLTQGVSETQFGVDQQIKRVDFAVMVAKAVLTQEQIDNAKDSGFTDVPDRGVKYVNALKEAGIANGKSDTRFGASDEITRGEAALMFAKAYKITGNTANIAFSDVSERYAAAVAALVDNKITSGKTPTKFGTTDPIKRGEFAIFLHKLETLKVDPEQTAKKITNVKAINDTKIELTFDGAFNADIADEIEKDPTRIVVFHGGQTANSDADTVIKSSFISFNADRTGASVILSDDVATVEAGIAYTVALMDGTDNEVADVVLKSEPTVLKAGADKPTVEVNKDQDKFVLNFKKKMSSAALDLDNYTLYDENDKELGLLSDFADEASKWVDSTEKTAVEFKIAPDKLLAGKTYKVKVDVAVETDKGDALSSSQRTITVKTPTVSEAQPVAKVARIVDDSIVVTFDQDLTEGLVSFNTSLFTIKSPTGKTLTIGDGLEAVGNELIIPIAQGPNDIVLDKDLTYTIDFPANVVSNEVFTNATNKEVKGLKAVAQKDVEVKSVKAELVRQSDEKTKADLLLTFDQRVNLATLDTDGVKIEESGKVYTLQAGADIEIYSGDTSGKTIKIKDVQAAFDNDFTPESGETYTVVIETGTVQTDAGAGSKVNRVKLKASLTGVDVVAPKIDKVTVESAEKIVVEFDQAIDAKNLKASDIKVLGFEKYRGGRFEELTLQGSTQLKFSASGDTLTITPADSSVKFQTGAGDDALALVKIAGAAIKGTNGVVAEDELLLGDVSDFIDNAAPIMIGADAIVPDGLTVTYSEPVEFDSADAASAGSQYTVEGAERDSYGTTATAADNEVSVTFKDDVFEDGEDYSQTKVIYKRNSTSAVQDTDGNEQANATLTGVSNSN
ncbi:S-layer homology domain-containing protein [Domibacillus aminovorans]|uniref:SLH domain-containing protein n=1 Tax=Domibacillus aminovorans TaxID=29332 RepID=A0A177L0I3_9BACI|nr:S-layer homology domain-containing protein [Domibacillus aminovorans]OAH58942.1 hypothetical protein AWH49_04560 [Domibacillus aminovorans]